MSDNSSNLSSLLAPFGLKPEEAQIYLHLLENGYKSALQISRELKIGRTKVYRIVDKLKDVKLVNERMDDLGMKFGAASYKQLELMIVEKEQELETLKRAQPVLFEQLEQLTTNPGIKTDATYLQGEEGLRQALENAGNAQEEILHLESGEMIAYVNADMLRRVKEEWRRRKLKVRTLSNFRADASGFSNEQQRLVEPEKMTILFEMYVYNDTLLLCHVDKGEITCVEVHNRAIADQHRQMFEFVWQCVG